MEFYFNEKYNYIYSGTMQEGDRVATKAEVAYWNKNHSTLNADRIKKLEENNDLYNKALNKPLVCGDYFVLADWITTYSNTLTLAKKYAEEQKELSANIIVLTQDGKMETIVISSYEEFEPYYNIVADEWARIIDLRNRYMVEIQNSQDPNNVEIVY